MSRGAWRKPRSQRSEATERGEPPRFRSRAALVGIVLAIGVGAGVTLWHGAIKPLPEGLSVEGPIRFARDVRFVADLTYVDPSGTRAVDQGIFDEMIRLIRGARRRLILDLVLYNDHGGVASDHEHPEKAGFRALTSELTDVLVDHKTAFPELEALLVTDPINTVYGGISAPHLERLRAHGIPVVITDLAGLRDSNALYSSFWRTFIRPFGRGRSGLFPNPFGGDRISLRTGLSVLNFKANHRKTLVADGPTGFRGLVTSANPHDGSSAHGNVAIIFDGRAVADLLETERAVVALSGEAVPAPLEQSWPSEGPIRMRVLTEGKIGLALDRALDTARSGDEIAIAVFYLSDRGIVRRLLAAHERGARVRVLLDPNKDAFGLRKNGIPNRPVAAELQRAGIPVRWCDTHGEQCHAKLFLRRRGADSILIAGSANFTRRNLRDFNLETDVWLSAGVESAVMREGWSYFERIWSNEPGRRYSVDYETYADESLWKTVVYRLGELSGIGTF